VALGVVAALLWPTGYFGPLSARIRGLFVKHTKTGNPLVDSVAEHQPASAGIYDAYLGLPLKYAYHGAAVCLYKRTSGCYFSGLYTAVAIHFSGKMSRLILICGPICAIGAAIWFGFVLDMVLEPVLLLLGKKGYEPAEPIEDKSNNAAASPPASQDTTKAKAKGKKEEPKKAVAKKKKGSNRPAPLAEYEEEYRPGGMMQIKNMMKKDLWEALPEEQRSTYLKFRVAYDNETSWVLRRLGLSAVLLAYLWMSSIGFETFVNSAHQIAKSLSDPQIVTWTRDGSGKKIVMDDYLRGYEWIDANTAQDARVIAWWDYGYQITGVAKRTSLADGNTWNHEHIATIGRTLTSPEKKAWNVIRHVADYVLVWAGGDSDDLGKSPHLARIGNSVFPDHCGDDDPRCNKFSFYGDGTPTPMMAKSLLYKAVKHNIAPGIKLDPRLFKEVHTTRYGKMRIYQVMNISQESKDWVADPKNRICDAPGSWYCVGQYPPPLEKLIAKRRSFAQVEDFNKAGEKSAYTRMVENEGKREL